MTDDPTAGDWQPSADQPIVPNEPNVPPAPPPSWQPPAYGPPPAPSAAGSNPPAAGWVRPEPTYRPAFGSPQNVDYIASPEREPRTRRRTGVLAAVGVVVLALIAGGIAVFVTSNNVGKPTATAVAGSSVGPTPGDSAHAPSSQPSAPSSQPSAPASPPQSPSSDDAAAGPLDKYLLSPADLGAGTLMALISGGRSVSDQATLDFCNFDYTSERLRTARVQVQYVSGSQAASNEFVRYRAGGAASAYSEIQKAVSGCPSTYREPGGVVSQIKRVTGLTGLVPKNVAVTFASTATTQGGVSTVWTAVVYQFDGDYFSGVYVYGTDKARVQSVAAALSAKSAKYLAEAAAGKPGTGGGPLVDTTPAGPGAQT
jgi:hypothetical protein